MKHKYVQGVEASNAADYRVIISTASIDNEAHDHWLKLSSILGGSIPTCMVRVELLELAAMYVFYLDVLNIDNIDYGDFESLADMLVQGAGLDEKEEGFIIRDEAVMLLGHIFAGYMRLMLHIRKKFKINRESVSEFNVTRLGNMVTASNDFEDSTSSYILIMR